MARSPCFSEVNGDGIVDLVVGSKGGALKYLETQSDGSRVERAGTENPFRQVAVGSNSAPAFLASDVLVVGNAEGTLKYAPAPATHIGDVHPH